jgi:superfamily I DNA and RNA helicase
MVPSKNFFSDLLIKMKQMYDDGIENQDIIEIAHDPNDKRNLWRVVTNALLGEKSHHRFISYIIRAKSGHLTYE